MIHAGFAANGEVTTMHMPHMDEYGLQIAGGAFEHALKVGAPGLSEEMRRVIVNNATRRIRHQLNMPAPALRPREED